jgi:hypothetical protein
MTAYIPLPIDVEPVDIEGDAFDYIAAQVPGWTPSPGNLEAWLIEALAQTAGELRSVAAVVPDTIFEYFGASILGLPPYAAVPATAITTWTLQDSHGYTVNAGTVIALTPSGSLDSYAFQLVADLVVPPGTHIVSGVQCDAVIAGSAASGLTGSIAIIDQVVFVTSVTLDSPTYGGADDEADDAYLSRLSALLTLLTPRPILPQDFALLVQDEIEGVARATAIDLYNPGPPVATNTPRCTTVAICDVNGNACSSTIKSEALSLLQSSREINFLVFVVDPTYTTIDVSFHVQCFPGFVDTDVEALVQSAVQSWLSPANWGLPPYGDTSGRSWVNTTSVRYLELAQVIASLAGVAYIVSLTFGVHGGALGTADVALSGAAPLTQPGTITGVADPG